MGVCARAGLVTTLAERGLLKVELLGLGQQIVFSPGQLVDSADELVYAWRRSKAAVRPEHI